MADSKRCVWECLQMVEAEPFGKEKLCDNDAYCMSKCVWTQECVRVLVLNGKQVSWKRCNAANSPLQIWYMKSTCESLLGGGFLCAYWSVIVYPNRCRLGEKHPPLWSSQRFNPPLYFTALFSSSNLPPALNVILSLVTFSLFQHMTELLHSPLCSANGYFQQISSAIER